MTDSAVAASSTAGPSAATLVPASAAAGAQADSAPASAAADSQDRSTVLARTAASARAPSPPATSGPPATAGSWIVSAPPPPPPPPPASAALAVEAAPPVPEPLAKRPAASRPSHSDSSKPPLIVAVPAPMTQAQRRSDAASNAVIANGWPPVLPPAKPATNGVAGRSAGKTAANHHRPQKSETAPQAGTAVSAKRPAAMPEINYGASATAAAPLSSHDLPLPAAKRKPKTVIPARKAAKAPRSAPLHTGNLLDDSQTAASALMAMRAGPRTASRPAPASQESSQERQHMAKAIAAAAAAAAAAFSAKSAMRPAPPGPARAASTPADAAVLVPPALPPASAAKTQEQWRDWHTQAETEDPEALEAPVPPATMASSLNHRQNGVAAAHSPQAPATQPPAIAPESMSPKPATPCFNGLQIGQEVVITACRKNSLSDILRRRPELEGMQGEVVAIPVYPSTWVSVRLATGEVVKLRSPNFEIINEEQGVVPVQTDRLRRSLVFNALGPGAKISILHHKRYTPASGFPVTATIMDNTPVFPSTWLTARVDEDGVVLKIRTSQMKLLKEAPRPAQDSGSLANTSASTNNITASTAAEASAIRTLHQNLRNQPYPMPRASIDLPASSGED